MLQSLWFDNGYPSRVSIHKAVDTARRTTLRALGIFPGTSLGVLPTRLGVIGPPEVGYTLTQRGQLAEQRREDREAGCNNGDGDFDECPEDWRGGVALMDFRKEGGG